METKQLMPLWFQNKKKPITERAAIDITLSSGKTIEEARQVI